MKNNIKIISSVLLLFISNKAFSQLDTLNYLKTNFEIQKSQYIGQPFSVLLNNMTQMQPKTAWSHSGSWKRNERNFTNFRFTFMEASFYNAVTLQIDWQDTIPANDIKFYENKNGFYFTNEEKFFYGNKIIKDIRVYR